ncbi:hypothetical protein ACS0TY_003188 [Phlomoides rotata]
MESALSRLVSIVCSILTSLESVVAETCFNVWKNGDRFLGEVHSNLVGATELVHISA